MPQKKILTKEQIIAGTVQFIEKYGSSKLSARDLSKFLGISTQPIYNEFSGMDEIEKFALAKAQSDYYSSLQESIDPNELFISSLFHYVQFAKNLPNLFKFIYTEHAFENDSVNSTYNGILIEKIKAIGNYSTKAATDFFNHAWIFAHGIASAIITKYITLSDDEIKGLLLDEKQALINYYKNNG